jgi:hypothetical protein
MVLSLKRWKSRSSPGIEAGAAPHNLHQSITLMDPQKNPFTCPNLSRPQSAVAGWSSPVARQAHNLKVTGSNPVPATNTIELHTPPLGAALSFVAQLSLRRITHRRHGCSGVRVLRRHSALHRCRVAEAGRPSYQTNPLLSCVPGSPADRRDEAVPLSRLQWRQRSCAALQDRLRAGEAWLSHLCRRRRLSMANASGLARPPALPTQPRLHLGPAYRLR